MKKEIEAPDVALEYILQVTEKWETDTSQESCLVIGSAICLTFSECCLYFAF